MNDQFVKIAQIKDLPYGQFYTKFEDESFKKYGTFRVYEKSTRIVYGYDNITWNADKCVTREHEVHYHLNDQFVYVTKECPVGESVDSTPYTQKKEVFDSLAPIKDVFAFNKGVSVQDLSIGDYFISSNHRYGYVDKFDLMQLERVEDNLYVGDYVYRYGKSAFFAEHSVYVEGV